ncbi:MAG TPA: PhnD/SsuA/transferrin family substrate-binding protein [Steroidobacteraceae bacterium]|nr:PhnD/SsuA/transferrin family substrate-binding protein [Steroidobacteraceae bacterium]
MIERILNARMYAVTPAVEAGWCTLLEHITRSAGVHYPYVPYPAPQPLEQLWSRPDLGCVFMCGYAIALGLAPVTPIAAPIPRAGWSAGQAVYRSDLIVRSEAPYQRLEDSFGARAGWTVEHSHSGFNAFRHHLLAYRTRARPRLYGQMLGKLLTARAVLDSVREGRIDIGPLDAYWHLLAARHAPELTDGIRVLASTELAPIPALVTTADAPADLVARLRTAFIGAANQPWFAPLGELLRLDGFAAAESVQYAPLLAWDGEAKAAGYELPA